MMNEPSLNENSTLAELAAYFLYYVVKDCYVNSTYQAYKARLNNHVLPELGTVRVKDLKKLDVQNLIFGLSNQDVPVSAHTSRLVKSILNRILDYAVDIEIIDRNVAQRIMLPKEVKYQPRIYTKGEIINLLDAAKDTFLHIPVLLAVKTGLRRSEILALQWSDISLENKSITVRKTIAGRSLNGPKTKYSQRCFQPPDAVLSALRSYWNEQKRLDAKREDVISGKAFVVGKDDGSSYNPSYMSRKFNELLKANNLPAIRFHDLRHAYATYAHENGMNVKELSLSLGHNSAATTLDNYVHLRDEYAVIRSINRMIRERREKNA